MRNAFCFYSIGEFKKRGNPIECSFCKGKLIRKKVDYTASRRGYHLIIDNVSAWVCEQCGEPLFDEETVGVIQEMLSAVNTKFKGPTKLSQAA